MTLSSDYWDMVKAWRAIIAEPLSDKEKTEACLAILRSYVNHLALVRSRQSNPPLRFYADMLALRRQLFPFPLRDEFGQLVILPLHHAVDEWLREHREAPKYHPVEPTSESARTET
jgi:hypothetical protein